MAHKIFALVLANLKTVIIDKITFPIQTKEEGKRLSRKKVAKGNQSSLVKIVNNAGFVAQYLPFCSLFTGCCLKPGEVYLKLCQLLEFVSFPQLF